MTIVCLKDIVFMHVSVNRAAHFILLDVCDLVELPV